MKHSTKFILLAILLAVLIPSVVYSIRIGEGPFGKEWGLSSHSDYFNSFEASGCSKEVGSPGESVNVTGSPDCDETVKGVTDGVESLDFDGLTSPSYLHIHGPSVSSYWRSEVNYEFDFTVSSADGNTFTPQHIFSVTDSGDTPTELYPRLSWIHADGVNGFELDCNDQIDYLLLGGDSVLPETFTVQVIVSTLTPYPQAVKVWSNGVGSLGTAYLGSLACYNNKEELIGGLEIGAIDATIDIDFQIDNLSVQSSSIAPVVTPTPGATPTASPTPTSLPSVTPTPTSTPVFEYRLGYEDTGCSSELGTPAADAVTVSGDANEIDCDSSDSAGVFEGSEALSINATEAYLLIDGPLDNISGKTDVYFQIGLNVLSGSTSNAMLLAPYVSGVKKYPELRLGIVGENSYVSLWCSSVDASSTIGIDEDQKYIVQIDAHPLSATTQTMRVYNHDTGAIEGTVTCSTTGSQGTYNQILTGYRLRTTTVSAYLDDLRVAYVPLPAPATQPTPTPTPTPAITPTPAPTPTPVYSLTIPDSRIPDWNPATVAETTKASAAGWTEYDVTCMSGCADGREPGGALGTPDCGVANTADESADASLDTARINCQIAAAPAQSVLYFPSGSYQVGHGTNILKILRGDIVLRGKSDWTSIIEVQDGSYGSEACTDGGGNSYCRSLGILAAQTGSLFGTASSWTGGFSRGETDLVVSTAVAGLSTGDYLIAYMDGGYRYENMNDTAYGPCLNGPPQKVGRSHCEYIDWTWMASGMESRYLLAHVAKVTSISPDGKTITIDQGLRLDSSVTCGNKYVRKINFLTGIGIENLKIITDSGSAQSAFTNTGQIDNALSLHGVAESWVTGNYIQRFNRESISSNFNVRSWYEGNKIQDTVGNSNSRGFYIRRVFQDNVVENNAFIDNDYPFYIFGVGGNVIAYNYMRDDRTSTSRAYFFQHGLYAHENLYEGNDLDGAYIPDTYWGSQGPRNTIYKNRFAGTQLASKNWSGFMPKYSVDSCAVDAGVANWLSNVDTNLMGNSFNVVAGGPVFCTPMPSCLSYDGQDLDNNSSGMFIEKNLYRETGGWWQETAEATTDCGTGTGDCPGSNPGASPAKGTNVEGDSAPAGWSTDTAPASLYRASKPDWWCDEACDWSDVQSGIGAWGDDFSGALCKLPAEITLVDSGTCTLP